MKAGFSHILCADTWWWGVIGCSSEGKVLTNTMTELRGIITTLWPLHGPLTTLWPLLLRKYHYIYDVLFISCSLGCAPCSCCRVNPRVLLVYINKRNHRHFPLSVIRASRALMFFPGETVVWPSQQWAHRWVPLQAPAESGSTALHRAALSDQRVELQYD